MSDDYPSRPRLVTRVPDEPTHRSTFRREDLWLIVIAVAAFFVGVLIATFIALL